MNASSLATVTAQSKGDVFRVISQNIPLNNYRLPDYVYRADLVPEDILTLKQRDRSTILDGAALPVTFEHGYPAVGNNPFWERLPAEPEDAYSAYMTFLELPEKSNSENPVRILTIIATLTGKALETISDWCHMYYWHFRSRAYDLFLIACHRKQREQRIMSIEGKHFTMAEQLLAQVSRLAELKLSNELKTLSQDPDAETETKTKDLIDMATKLVSVQRISVGLPSGGPEKLSVQMDGPRHTTVDETFKHIAKEGAGEEAPAQRSPEMDGLLRNPDDLSRIQELMIKLNNPTKMLPIWGNNEIIDVDVSTRRTESTDEASGAAEPPTANGERGRRGDDA